MRPMNLPEKGVVFNGAMRCTDAVAGRRRIWLLYLAHPSGALVAARASLTQQRQSKNLSTCHIDSEQPAEVRVAPDQLCHLRGFFHPLAACASELNFFFAASNRDEKPTIPRSESRKSYLGWRGGQKASR